MTSPWGHSADLARFYTVTEPQRHPRGYTVYKVTARVSAWIGTPGRGTGSGLPLGAAGGSEDSRGWRLRLETLGSRQELQAETGPQDGDARNPRQETGTPGIRDSRMEMMVTPGRRMDSKMEIPGFEMLRAFGRSQDSRMEMMGTPGRRMDSR